jgi:tetratricopeptide (TPR) repeat protein
MKLLITLTLFCSYTCLLAQSDFDSRIYRSSVTGNMEEWKTVLAEMTKSTSKDSAFLERLLNYHYGYVALCLANKRNDEAVLQLQLAEKVLERFETKVGKTSQYYSYLAAFTAFHVALRMYLAPVLVPVCVKYSKLALAKDAKEPQAWITSGNVNFYLPVLLGGSKQKAIEAWQTAIYLMRLQEKKNNNNWERLFVTISIARAYKSLKNYQRAEEIYKQVLKEEPDYVWVKKYLYPQLKEAVRSENTAL